MHDTSLITTIAVGFAAAWVLGLITQKLGLSPIVGYLLAGVAIGPNTPGFVGDPHIAHQLSEVGVILLMFGVGLHFHLKDLLAVKGIAVPGAVVQSAVATGLTVAIFHYFGWDWRSSVVLGMAMAVASTVVLMRVLMDRDMLSTVHGHVAVGWLIVEDVFTVLALVFVPMLASAESSSAVVAAVQQAVGAAADPTAQAGEATATGGGGGNGLVAIAWALGKLAMLVAVVLLAGSRIVPWVLVQVAKLGSRELFTLTVLVLSVTVAVLSATVFGASPALGAFLAGMVVGQSPVSHQAAADALPMRDAFAVLFFVSTGMLFDPEFVAAEPLMLAAAVGVVLIAKPLAALMIVALLGYSVRTALTVAIGLAQIGEFSFILSDVARAHHLMPDEGHNLLVGAAMLSITLNPWLFGSIDRIERWLRNRPALWRLLNARTGARVAAMQAENERAMFKANSPVAVIVGYGPVGRVVDALLRDTGLETVIIDLNMDTIASLKKRGRLAVYGDASRMEILEQAGIKRAVHLVVTLPHSAHRVATALAARALNPSVEITMRARYLREREELEHAGVATIVFEEGEAGIALARHVLVKRGMKQSKIDAMLAALRTIWALPEGMPDDAKLPTTVAKSDPPMR